MTDRSPIVGVRSNGLTGIILLAGTLKQSPATVSARPMPVAERVRRKVSFGTHHRWSRDLAATRSAVASPSVKRP
jgi:hypothetical protein